MLLYDSAVKEQVVYSVTKTGLAAKSFSDIKINEVYPYKGKLVVYAYNKKSKYNSLYLFENEKFTELQKNFDLVNSYDFGKTKYSMAIIMRQRGTSFLDLTVKR